LNNGTIKGSEGAPTVAAMEAMEVLDFLLGIGRHYFVNIREHRISIVGVRTAGLHGRCERRSAGRVGKACFEKRGKRGRELVINSFMSEGARPQMMMVCLLVWEFTRSDTISTLFVLFAVGFKFRTSPINDSWSKQSFSAFEICATISAMSAFPTE
jgi:hypothetical protein